MKEKHIILNADDFGANDFIDHGIYRAIDAGRVTSVSAFVTHDDSQSRIQQLRKKHPQIPIGLHFSFTSGSPISGRDSLLTTREQGRLLFQPVKNYKYRPARKKGVEIANELELQLDRLQNLLGGYHQIDHVTVHHNLTNFELKYFRPKVDVLTRHSIPMRSIHAWSASLTMIDDSDDNRLELAPIMRRGLELKILNIDMLASKKREKYARKRGLKFPDYLCDVIYGQPSVPHFEYLLDHFKGDDDDTEYSIEYMLHLGDRTDLTEDQYKKSLKSHGLNDEYYDMRQKELDTLLSINLDQYLDRYGVRKSCYRDLDYN